MKTNLKITPANPKNLSYKFVYDDGNFSFVKSTNFQDAAILSVAARIRAAKSKKLIGSWVKNESGTWEHVVQDLVLKF